MAPQSYLRSVWKIFVTVYFFPPAFTNCAPRENPREKRCCGSADYFCTGKCSVYLFLVQAFSKYFHTFACIIYNDKLWAHQGWLFDNGTHISQNVCLNGGKVESSLLVVEQLHSIWRDVCAGGCGRGRGSAKKKQMLFFEFPHKKFIDPRPRPENNTFSGLIKNKQRSAIALKISRTALQLHDLCSHLCCPILQRASSVILVAV